MYFAERGGRFGFAMGGEATIPRLPVAHTDASIGAGVKDFNTVERLGMATLLALGINKDPHVTRVVKELQRRGHDVVVVDYQRPDMISVSFDRSHQPAISVNGRPLQGPYLVWDRMKITRGKGYYFTDQEPDETEGTRERRYALRAQLWAMLNRTLILDHRLTFVNNPRSVSRLSLKTLQHDLGVEVGFYVPNSLITSRKADALNFIDANGAVITKSLGPSTVISPHNPMGVETLMTMELTRAEVESVEEEWLEGPLLLQRQIHKAYELRVFAVGDEVYAFRVDSQKYELTRVDWRYGGGAMSFYPVEVDASITEGVIRFLRKLDLIYGSFDFIVDVDGCAWFLECNPDGQWGFVESEEAPKLSLRLAEHIHRKMIAHEISRLPRAELAEA